MFQIKPKTIAKGDTLELEYSFFDEEKQPVDLSSFTGYYIVSEYGFEDIDKLTKTMTLKTDTTNTFTVTLYSFDTIGLGEGTFTVKVVFVSEGNYYKKARGVLNILKDSETVETTNI